MELQGLLGLCLMFTQGHNEAVARALMRAFELAEYLDSKCKQLRFIGLLHIFHERMGDFTTALAWAERSRDVAAAMGTGVADTTAYSLLGISYHLMGDQIAARHAFERAIQSSPPFRLTDTVNFGFDHRNRAGIGLARTLWLLGYPQQARAHAEMTIAEAEAQGHPLTHCIALIWAVSIHQWMGDLERAGACIDRIRSEAKVNGLGPYLAVALGMTGEIAVKEGRVDYAVEALETCLARLHAAKYELLTTAFNTSLAEAFLAAGRHSDALTLVDETIQLNARNGDLFAMPELLRIRAAVLQSVGQTEASMDALNESLDLSRKQGARSWELRAATDLARILSADGDHASASGLLSGLLATFDVEEYALDQRTAEALITASGSSADSGDAHSATDRQPIQPPRL